MSRLGRPQVLFPVLFLVVLAVILTPMPRGAIAHQVPGPAAGGLAPVLPVANPCPRYAAGSVIEQPPALFSHDGVLSVEFSYQTTTDNAGRTLFCFMTPSGMENPTLHIKPGDHLIITVTNNTPAQGLMMTVNPPNCGPGGNQMTFSSVNIHYHGTNTSPTCGSDEVIKTLVNSGQTFQYDVAFPSNEPPGLYWYHPHIHGIAEKAALGGGTGAIVVDGIENVQPLVSGLRQRIFVIRDQPTVQAQEEDLMESAGGVADGIPMQDLTINNITTDAMTDTSKYPPVTTYTPAILHMQPGETQFWRISNSCADTILDLQLQYDGVPQPIQLISIDGVSVNSQDGAQPGQPIIVTHFRLPTAARVEFLAKAPPLRVRSAQLVTLNIETGQDGDDDPNRPLFNIFLSSQDDNASAPDDRVPQFRAMNPDQRRFAGLAIAPVAARRVLYFNENSTQFFMDVQGVPEHVFDPNAPAAITATQGTVEEWAVQNRTREAHEFHIHQIHFLVESQNNFEINGAEQSPAVTRQYLDTVHVPAWDGNSSHPYPSVTLRLDFRGPDVGDFVFHCHILEHEDGGMMNIIHVVAPGKAPPPGPGPSSGKPPGPPPGPPGPPAPPPMQGMPGMNMKMN